MKLEKILRSIFVLFGASIILMPLGCSSDNNDDDKPEAGDRLLSKIIVEGDKQNVLEFGYDLQNRLDYFRMINEDEGDAERTDMVYGSNGKVNSMVWFDENKPAYSEYYTITYAGNQMLVKLDGETDTLFFRNNRMIKIAPYKGSADDAEHYEYDNAGNCKKITAIVDHDYTSTSTLTHDQRKGAFSMLQGDNYYFILLEYYLLFGSNNVTKMVETVEYLDPEEAYRNYTITTTFSYEYDSKGYPVKCQMKMVNTNPYMDEDEKEATATIRFEYIERSVSL